MVYPRMFWAKNGKGIKKSGHLWSSYIEIVKNEMLRVVQLETEKSSPLQSPHFLKVSGIQLSYEYNSMKVAWNKLMSVTMIYYLLAYII